MEVIEPRLKTITQKDVWAVVVKHNLPMFMWRLPGKQNIHVAISLNNNIKRLPENWQSLDSSVVFKPFKGDGYYFSPDYELLLDKQGGPVKGLFYGNLIQQESKRNLLLQLIGSIEETNESEKIVAKLGIEKERQSQERYLDNVQKGVNFIKNGGADKVVLSRIKEINFESEISIPSAFNKLTISYPSAFISALYLPDEKCTWLGASPEYLAKIDKSNSFSTMSLASTQHAFTSEGKIVDPETVKWTDKEYEEQGLVTEFIEQSILSAGVSSFQKDGPNTIQAGNLLHLKTDFFISSNQLSQPNILKNLICELNPTPAVCGLPRDDARRFININEPHDRELYTGFVGLVNHDSETDLFVNLRTMKVSGKKGQLFVGCGITKDSEPEKELNETQIKSSTLLNVVCDEIIKTNVIGESNEQYAFQYFLGSNKTTICIKTTNFDLINYCYLVFDSESKEGVLIDPSWQPDLIEEEIRKNGVKIKGVLLTHHHNDHIHLSNYFTNKYCVSAWMHRIEFEYYEPVLDNLRVFDHFKIELGSIRFKALHVPGHTKGGVLYIIDNHVFTGDTLYMEGCGVCDDVGGDPFEMFDSLQLIKRKIKKEDLIFSGHSFGKPQGLTFEELLKSNIYLNIPDEDQFVKFRMRKMNTVQYK